jgi:hypothetical protein
LSDNELLLALSEMMDNKLKPLDEKISKLEADISRGFNEINIVLENEIRQEIKLLAENYLPAAKRYEKAVLETENMKADIELLKKVVTEHSEKLQKIS